MFSPREDPKGKALRISHSWRVTHRIKTGVVGKDGQIALAHPIAIRRGDFVDCAVSVEVVTMRNKQGRKVMVHFSPREVVRLRGASDVNVRELRRGCMQTDAVLYSDCYGSPPFLPQSSKR